MNRRDLLKAAAAGGVAGLVGCSSSGREEPRHRFPALFISHGSPRQALIDDDYALALRGVQYATGHPSAIVIVSAHFEEPSPIRVTTSEKPPMIYDFYGFEDELYKITYACPGAPKLATEIIDRLRDAGLPAQADPERGLDHGAWVPLHIGWHAACWPVVQVSLSTDSPDQLMKIGRTLAPLRERDVLLVGSGGVTHNLRRGGGDIATANREFDGWVRQRLESLDVEAFRDWKSAVPNWQMSHPTTEHFDPIHFVLGTLAPGEKVEHVYEGMRGTFSMRCFTVGA